MRNAVVIGAAAMLLLAGCTKQQSQADRANGDVPSKAEAVGQIEARLKSRSYTVPFPKQTHQCTEHFDIAQVEVIDTRADAGTAIVKAAAVLTSRGNFIRDDWVGMNCFGGPWAAGQTANYVEDFTFQKWNSGWVLQ